MLTAKTRKLIWRYRIIVSIAIELVLFIAIAIPIKLIFLPSNQANKSDQVTYAEPIIEVETMAGSITPSITPTLTPIPSVSPTAKNTSGLGISGGGLDHYNQEELNQYFERLKELGVRWLRYDFDRSVIQKNGPDSYRWESIDRVVTTAKKYGMNSLGVITYSPEWARLDSCDRGLKCPPKDFILFGKFAGQVAARYKDSVNYWQVWNEPNLAGFMGPPSSVDVYVNILKEAYTEIKKANPKNSVITGGIAAAANESDGSLSPVTFIENLYAKGGKPYFDAVAMHPYSFPAAPGYQAEWNTWQQIKNVRQVMSANGNAAKKLWITEYGAPTGGPGKMHTLNQFSFEDDSDYMSEEAQAEIARDATSLYKNMGSWVGPMFWYSLIDEGVSRDTPENFFGLLRFDGTKKPAYEVYKNAIN